MTDDPDAPIPPDGISITAEELGKINLLFQTVMEDTVESLFMREGRILGKRIVEEATAASGGDTGDGFLTAAAQRIVANGWARNAMLGPDRAELTSSIERRAGQDRCHRTRGILIAIYETHLRSLVYAEQQPAGDPERVAFTIERMEI